MAHPQFISTFQTLRQPLTNLRQPTLHRSSSYVHFPRDFIVRQAFFFQLQQLTPLRFEISSSYFNALADGHRVHFAGYGGRMLVYIFPSLLRSDLCRSPPAATTATYLQ